VFTDWLLRNHDFWVVGPFGWVISSRFVEKKRYRLNHCCYEWIKGVTTLKIQAVRSFETSISSYPTARPKSHKTCYLTTKTDLQLWNPSALCCFLWGNAASFPHYLNRIFSCGLPSCLSLVTAATRCLGDRHKLQTSRYGRRYTATWPLGRCTVQIVQNTKCVILLEAFFCLV
jgi:hypothetical protein